MGLGVFAVVVVMGIVLGYLIQMLVKPAATYEWLVVAIAVVGGAFIASEMVVGSTLFEGIKDWGPQIDGLFLVPAIAGALLVGIVAEIGLHATSPATA